MKRFRKQQDIEPYVMWPSLSSDGFEAIVRVAFADALKLSSFFSSSYYLWSESDSPRDMTLRALQRMSHVITHYNLENRVVYQDLIPLVESYMVQVIKHYNKVIPFDKDLRDIEFYRKHTLFLIDDLYINRKLNRKLAYDAFHDFYRELNYIAKAHFTPYAEWAVELARREEVEIISVNNPTIGNIDSEVNMSKGELIYLYAIRRYLNDQWKYNGLLHHQMTIASNIKEAFSQLDEQPLGGYVELRGRSCDAEGNDGDWDDVRVWLARDKKDTDMYRLTFYTQDITANQKLIESHLLLLEVAYNNKPLSELMTTNEDMVYQLSSVSMEDVIAYLIPQKS